MDNKNFRKKALDKISSPEELDQYISIIKPSYIWILYSLIILTVLALIWGFFGKIPLKVNGVGVIESKNEIEYIYSHSNGVLHNFNYDIGDTIKSGELIGMITQPELNAKLSQLKLELKTLLKEDSLTNPSNTLMYDEEIRKDQITRNNLELEIKNIEYKIIYRKEQVITYEDLYVRNLISQNQLVDIKEELSDLKTMLGQKKATLISFNISSQKGLNSMDDDELDFVFKKQKLEMEINSTLKLIDDKEKLFAHKDGVVNRITVQEGDLVNTESLICIIEDDKVNDSHEIKLYIPFNSGEIFPGAIVQIELSTAKRDIYGFMLGNVIEVSHYPSSFESLNNELRNDQVVNLVKSLGVTYKLTVSIQSDSTTYTGYKWSSRKGPNFKIQNGTICFGAVIVKEQRPLDYIIPSIKEFF